MLSATFASFIVFASNASRVAGLAGLRKSLVRLETPHATNHPTAGEAVVRAFNTDKAASELERVTSAALLALSKDLVEIPKRQSCLLLCFVVIISCFRRLGTA